MTTTDDPAQLAFELRQREEAVRQQAEQIYLDGMVITHKAMKLAMALNLAAAAAFVYFLLDGPKSDGILLFSVGAALCGELTVVTDKLKDISNQLATYNNRK